MTDTSVGADFYQIHFFTLYWIGNDMSLKAVLKLILSEDLTYNTRLYYSFTGNSELMRCRDLDQMNE